MVDVPCNGCTLCCRNDMILLHPEDGDDPSAYQTEAVIHPLTGKPSLMVAKKPDVMECVYLGDGGCTIHGRAPVICRKFDCGRMFLKFTRAERRQMVRRGLGSQEVFDQGRRVAALRADEKVKN